MGLPTEFPSASALTSQAALVVSSSRHPLLCVPPCLSLYLEPLSPSPANGALLPAQGAAGGESRGLKVGLACGMAGGAHGLGCYHPVRPLTYLGLLIVLGKVCGL